MSDTVVVAVHEDWDGGAGNGLGTLYAYHKACAQASARGIDLTAKLRAGESVSVKFAASLPAVTPYASAADCSLPHGWQGHAARTAARRKA